AGVVAKARRLRGRNPEVAGRDEVARRHAGGKGLEPDPPDLLARFPAHPDVVGVGVAHRVVAVAVAGANPVRPPGHEPDQVVVRAVRTVVGVGVVLLEAHYDGSALRLFHADPGHALRILDVLERPRLARDQLEKLGAVDGRPPDPGPPHLRV